MTYITKQLAAKMEACIKHTHIAVTALYPYGKTIEVQGGAACFSGFDSYLSQVVGWGFETTKKNFHSELTAIEAFYAALGHKRIDIELCPFVGSELPEFLTQRGYYLSELNNVSVLDLANYSDVPLESGDFEVRTVQSSEFKLWAKKVAQGFGYPEAEEQFLHYINAEGATAFGVFEQGKLIAGATIAIHQKVGDLGVASTLSAYRGNGLQKKLLLARLNYAKEQGVDLAIVTTTPGSISDLNVQKVGFRFAYTRMKLTTEK